MKWNTNKEWEVIEFNAVLENNDPTSLRTQVIQEKDVENFRKLLDQNLDVNAFIIAQDQIGTEE